MFKSISRVFHRRSHDDASHLVPNSASTSSSELQSYIQYVQQDVMFTGVGPVDPPARRNNTPRRSSPNHSNDITYTGAGPQYHDITFTGAGAGTPYTDITYTGAKSPSASQYQDVTFTGAGPSPSMVLSRPWASRRPYRDIMNTGADSYMPASGNFL
ncbi:hypothetical protein BOTBODRAFT_28871 [Botryobasidium botryosum FD-172 SS1]|uniref:Uncharacterized protein n=1 Tax=Botryobasidium botryosum (strain FD-172 SS1) TaxID=930990 RepID=A0A067MSC1_BOTB1|nr:hypothetical protein BOTBODRAFT_28871 [Botryobasidium botryosum FD-172 SS1]